MKKKKITVTLQRGECPLGDSPYLVVRLTNTTTVSYGAKFFRVGDRLLEPEADKLAAVSGYEVIITLAKV